MSTESDNEELVTIFRSRAINAEIEAEQIHALLLSAGIESVLVEPAQHIPPGRMIVRVLASQETEAKAVIAAALESGEAAMSDDGELAESAGEGGE